nr:B-cell receptor CD22-like [Danio rerio]|eukprot:XP_021333356.1 B-cell receptor CD22-like [Danio rerio]
MCISDSNPPALNFSWFKENQSSAVGSGQSFSAVQSGRFYCEAHNPHGAQRSDAVTVTVHQHAGRNIVITATSVAILIIFIIASCLQFFLKGRAEDLQGKSLRTQTHMQVWIYSPRPLTCTTHLLPFTTDLLKTPAPLLILRALLNITIHQSTGGGCSERRSQKSPILRCAGGATGD